MLHLIWKAVAVLFLSALVMAASRYYLPVATKQIEANMPSTESSPLAPKPSISEECYASTVIKYKAGHGAANVSASRNVPERALGEPARGENLDFVALGYGGTLILRFEGAAVALPGTNDLEIVETTNGSWNCYNYEEKAAIYVSQQLVSAANQVDNSLFQYVGESCNHGVFIDVHAATGFDYFTMVKIVDITPPYAQLPDRDGYDVDGIVALHAACFNPLSTSDNQIFSDFSVFPNPSKGLVNIEFTSLESAHVDILIFDMQGRLVKSIFNGKVAEGESQRLVFDGRTLAAAPYTVQAWAAGKSVTKQLIITP